MEWDTAAGQAIAEFAGCTVINYDDKSRMRYNKENLLNPWFVVQG
jgi:3'(2'), 5'-bisphosphate nucleotidase